MYAVIKTGGKQYKVVAGEKLKVEQIPADIGAEITIDQVLAVGAGDQLTVGTPLVDGATVSATVLSHGRHPKVRIFKMRRRKHYRKQQGHRQNYTELFVSGISSAAGSTRAEAAAVAGAHGGSGDAMAGIDQVTGVAPTDSGTETTSEELGRVDPSLPPSQPGADTSRPDSDEMAGVDRVTGADQIDSGTETTGEELERVDPSVPRPGQPKE